MTWILHLETATPVCSVALSHNGEVAGFLESADEKSHATQLTILIGNLLSAHGLTISTLDAISLSLGPGSYTGLRIGTSVAKGIAYASGKPLIGIPTLKSLAAGFIARELHGDSLLCPMLDARRMEVYSAIFDHNLREIRAVEAVVLTESTYSDYLDKQQVWFFGNGAGKASGIISHWNARFKPDFNLSATFQSGLAEESYRKQEFLNTAYFEPHYLKEFIASIPKNKVF